MSELAYLSSSAMTRRCSECGSCLRSGNKSSLCGPCQVNVSTERIEALRRANTSRTPIELTEEVTCVGCGKRRLVRKTRNSSYLLRNPLCLDCLNGRHDTAA